MARLLPVLTAGLLILTTACTGSDEPPAAGRRSPSVSPAPSTTPPPRQLPPAEYQTWISAIERDIRTGLDRAMAAKTLAEVDAARLSLVGVLSRRKDELATVRPPDTATETHEKVQSLVYKHDTLRDITRAADAAEKNTCGLSPSPAEQMYEARQTLWITVAGGAPEEITAAAKKEGFSFGAKLLPRELVRPEVTDRRLRNGTIVQRTGRRGPSSVRIDNDDIFDVAVLARAGGKGPRAMIYVRAGAKATLRGVAGDRTGTFTLSFKSGNDWDQKRRGFRRNCSFETFEQTFNTRSNWAIDLAESTLGNAPTKPTDPF